MLGQLQQHGVIEELADAHVLAQALQGNREPRGYCSGSTRQPSWQRSHKKAPVSHSKINVQAPEEAGEFARDQALLSSLKISNSLSGSCKCVVAAAERIYEHTALPKGSPIPSTPSAVTLNPSNPSVQLTKPAQKSIAAFSAGQTGSLRPPRGQTGWGGSGAQRVPQDPTFGWSRCQMSRSWEHHRHWDHHRHQQAAWGIKSEGSPKAQRTSVHSGNTEGTWHGQGTTPQQLSCWYR